MNGPVAHSNDVIVGLEDSLIGKIMFDPSTIPEVLKVIEPVDLSPKCGAIFEACVAQHRQGLACELASVVFDLDNSGRLAMVGGPVVIAELADLEATAVDVLDVARKLKRSVLEQKQRELHKMAAAGDVGAGRQIRDLEERLKHVAAPRMRVKPLTVDEILEDTTPQAIVEGLLFEGSPTLYCGLPKRGKTYSAAQMALCLASGNEFVGLRVRQSRVLYLSWELAAASLFGRMKRIAADVGLPDPTKFLHSKFITIYAHRRSAQIAPIDLSCTDGWTDLGDLVEGSKAEVLIIDTVSKVAAIEMKDVTGWHAFINDLNGFARERDISILAIDHAHRQRIDSNASVAAMGAQVKGSAIPCIAKLTETMHDDPREKRWKIEIDSWYGDSTPTWFRRPGEQVAGMGCVAADPPKEAASQTEGSLCQDLVRERLESGPRPKEHIIKLFDGTFSPRMIERAAKNLGVVTTKPFSGKALWTLPEGGQA